MRVNMTATRMLGLCIASVIVMALSFALAPRTRDDEAKAQMAALNEQKESLSKSVAALTKEKESADRLLADVENSLLAIQTERDALAAELGQFKHDIEGARQAAIALEDMYYGYYMNLFYYDDQIGALTDNNDVDGAIEMENRDGVVKGVISFLDNPLLNMVTADQRAQRGQISAALLSFNQTFAALMDSYTPVLIKITKMQAALDNYLTLAEEAQIKPEKLYANMEIIRNAFGGEISPERFEAETIEVLDSMLRIEACLDMALRAYRTVLADSGSNRDFLRQLENLLDSTRTCYNEYRTPEMDIRFLQSQQERDEIYLTMLKATKALMDGYCSNKMTIAELGPGITSNSRRVFKVGIGYVEIHARFKKSGSVNQLLTAFEYADTGLGSHMMAVHYYDMEGQIICIDSQHSGVTIYLKDGVVLDSTVGNPEKYISQSEKLKECILYGDLSKEYFNGIHFDTVHRQ